MQSKFIDLKNFHGSSEFKHLIHKLLEWLFWSPSKRKPCTKNTKVVKRKKKIKSGKKSVLAINTDQKTMNKTPKIGGNQKMGRKTKKHEKKTKKTKVWEKITTPPPNNSWISATISQKKWQKQQQTADASKQQRNPSRHLPHYEKLRGEISTHAEGDVTEEKKIKIKGERDY